MTGFKHVLKWLAIGLGAVIGSVFMFLVAAGFASELGMAPAIVVQTGEELPDRQLQALKKAKILSPDETVQFYYSDGMFKITEGGAIMSSERVISYYHDEKQLKVHAFPLDTLDHLEQHAEGNAITFAEFVVWQRGDDDNRLTLFVPHEEGRHMELFSALETQISENQKRWEAEGT